MCGCNKPCGCPPTKIGCKEKDISTDCILYTGNNLECSGIQENTVLTEVIQQLDEFICNRLQESEMFLNIENVGAGAGVYKGETAIGVKQLKSLVAGSSNISIIEGTDTISFSVSSSADIYTTSGSFNPTTGLLTFTRNDSTTYSVSLAGLIQVQANYLEENTTSKAHILNRNPTKTITSTYTLGAADNNYVIAINNGINPITITIPSTGLATNNYFVGFIQLGTGNVTFVGYDIKPVDFAPVIYGQGHNAAVEIIGGSKLLFGSLKKE